MHGSAPRGKEINHHHLAAQFGQVELLALQRGALKSRRVLSDLGQSAIGFIIAPRGDAGGHDEQNCQRVSGKSFHRSVLDDVLQPQIRDFANLFKCCLDLLFARILQANLEPVQNRLLLVQPRADDERKSELRLISRIVRLEQRDLLRRDCPAPRSPVRSWIRA